MCYGLKSWVLFTTCFQTMLFVVFYVEVLLISLLPFHVMHIYRKVNVRTHPHRTTGTIDFKNLVVGSVTDFDSAVAHRRQLLYLSQLFALGGDGQHLTVGLRKSRTADQTTATRLTFQRPIQLDNFAFHLWVVKGNFKRPHVPPPRAVIACRLFRCYQHSVPHLVVDFEVVIILLAPTSFKIYEDIDLNPIQMHTNITHNQAILERSIYFWVAPRSSVLKSKFNLRSIYFWVAPRSSVLKSKFNLFWTTSTVLTIWFWHLIPCALIPCWLVNDNPRNVLHAGLIKYDCFSRLLCVDTGSLL